MRDYFERANPYFCAVCFLTPIIVTCFASRWQYGLISLALAAVVYALLVGVGKLLKNLRTLLVLFVLVVISNPLVSHNGATELFFLNGRPVTLEAFEYGLSLGIMLMAVLLWSGCWNQVMTEDKLSYIFRRLSPGFALVLSMSLRLVPMYMRRWESMRNSLKASGIKEGSGPVTMAKHSAACFAGLMDWAINNSSITASSMVARGACLSRKKGGRVR